MKKLELFKIHESARSWAPIPSATSFYGKVVVEFGFYLTKEYADIDWFGGTCCQVCIHPYCLLVRFSVILVGCGAYNAMRVATGNWQLATGSQVQSSSFPGSWTQLIASFGNQLQTNNPPPPQYKPQNSLLHLCEFISGVQMWNP